jgi:hypothetical protein
MGSIPLTALNGGFRDLSRLPDDSVHGFRNALIPNIVRRRPPVPDGPPVFPRPPGFGVHPG